MTEQAIVDRPFTAASFQAYMDEGKLMGSRNRETGEVFVPPRPIDPATHGEAMEWVELSGRGLDKRRESSNMPVLWPDIILPYAFLVL